MHPDPLQQPLGALMHPTEHLTAMDSLLRASQVVRSGLGSVPFLRDGALVGLISESSLATAFANGRSLDDSCETALSTELHSLPLHATGAEAFRLLAGPGPSVVVVQDRGFPVGLVRPSDLFGGPPTPSTPRFIGGMATPFGVYLTTGAVSAGAGPFALMATGFVMFMLFLFGILVTSWVLGFMSPGTMADRVADGLPVVLFLLGLRALPLAGIHAAEHKVVHAIERYEPLTLQAVKRMPRVHQRCGTNLAAAGSLFIGVASSSLFVDLEPRLLLAGVVTLLFWRPLGTALQLFVTTRPPTDRQVAAAIKVGEGLLRRHRELRNRPPTAVERVWNSGVAHIIMGSLVAYWLTLGASLLFGFHLPL